MTKSRLISIVCDVDQIALSSRRQKPEPPQESKRQDKLLQLLQDWMAVDPLDASATYEQQKRELIESLARSGRP
jgi:hypothetical protein